MLLSDLLSQVDHRLLYGSVDRPITALTQDSREAGPGSVFVAIRGLRVDGHRFVPSVEAEAVVVERPVEAPAGVTVVEVDDTRLALARLAAALHGHPSEELDVVGVTGTNGKTTTTWMLEAIARAAGHKVGVVGTTGNRIDGLELPTAYTTPEAPQWQGLLREMVDNGCSVVAAEVSSIGLAARRVDGTRFAVAIYTNFSQDHLDAHGTMEAYAAAKARLFTEFEIGRAIINVEDAAVAGLLPLTMPVWTFGLEGGDLHALELDLQVRGSFAAMQTPAGVIDLSLPLPGAFNVENALAAAGAALALGVPPEAIESGLAGLPQVPGRLERVDRDDLDVFVDYAHTPDALETVLATLRPLARGRLLVVFGCGGDRDRHKRADMGRLACAGADLVFATSDNPRTEDPAAILGEVRAGLDEHARVITDRREAINEAIRTAAPGDVLLIAGKGHETTQEICGVKHPFDDRVVAREAP
ncbi:MAG TPA: UDP-N-acetylmuramoyl-L-alanyl-D-glutamate--2,6-diaminopimelate ligase [Myxococcota bacterium]|nr:UDP-N-acetylmuramoyl-L-alanyl-D-glutamate--2,6-diaminopimelate ligase [Myxococcota bacterium]